jgi:RNA polymerase sigma-70 factor, ECF subfamily
MTSDGGGKAIAVIRVLHGAARIARLWYAITRRRPGGLGERRFVRVNNQLGIANYVRGRLHSVATIDTDGRCIFAYYSIANPDKLHAYASIARHVTTATVTTDGARASGG